MANLDNRSRDENGQIRAKRSDTRVDTLRQTYGPGFAAGVRGDAQLGTILDRSGQPSLSQLVRGNARGKRR